MEGIFVRRGSQSHLPDQVRSSASWRSAWTAWPSSSLASSSRRVRAGPAICAADARKRTAELRPVSDAISHAFVRAISFSKAYRAAPQLGHWLGIGFVYGTNPHT